MGPVNDKNLMANLQMLKITGLYQLLNSGGPKLYGLTIYGWAAVVEAVYMIAGIFALITSLIYCVEDVNACAQYTVVAVALTMVTFKLYWMIRYADTIRTCVQATRMNCLSYGRHRTRTLAAGRTESKFLSTMVGTIWTMAVLFWILLPLFVWDQVTEVTFDDHGTRRYRANVLNFVFPISEWSYDRYFAVFYLAESFTMIVFTQVTLTFDALVISLCIAILYQLKTVGDSFAELGTTHDSKITSIKDDESILISDLKTSIQDKQIIYNYLRIIYDAFRPVILCELAIDSTCMILLSSVVIMNYYNGMSLVSPINLKFMGASLIRITHLFMICYLFTNINEQKNSLNFALYSSNWTEKSLQYRKLLLYAMRMNYTDNLKLKFTIVKIVNFELYGEIIRTTYSILSVLVKWYAKKKY